MGSFGMERTAGQEKEAVLKRNRVMSAPVVKFGVQTKKNGKRRKGGKEESMVNPCSQ